MSVKAVVRGGATHAGFIFFEKSPRNVSVEQAAELASIAKRGGLKSVAVTVNATDEALREITSVMKPDVIQLHGKETPERVAAMRQAYGLDVWKALSISTADDLKKLDEYRGIADRFLLDAKPPKGSDLPGGNAVSFDWALLSQISDDTDYLLAGGINLENLNDALAQNPPALDLSSGVESAPGVKDIAKIEALLSGIRNNTSAT